MLGKSSLKQKNMAHFITQTREKGMVYFLKIIFPVFYNTIIFFAA